MNALASPYIKIRHTLELIKFSHSLFALPFALSAFLVETRGHFSGRLLLWVIVAVVCARTAAMAFNRLVDADIDAKNPRTKNRHIPASLLSKSYVTVLIFVASCGFVFSAWQLNRLAFFLSFPCLALLFLYSLAKHFTVYTQFILGFCLGMAPVGAAIAVTGRITMGSLILSAAVQVWVAGFDLLYALQDLNFDRDEGLHSLPVKLGPIATLKLSSLLHGMFLILLTWYGGHESLAWPYWLGLGINGLVLWWEHRLIRDDLRRINTAFFTANGLLSLLFLLSVAISTMLMG